MQVLTYDYRGMGESRPRPLRELSVSMSEWGTKDLAGVVDWSGGGSSEDLSQSIGRYLRKTPAGATSGR